MKLLYWKYVFFIWLTMVFRETEEVSSNTDEDVKPGNVVDKILNMIRSTTQSNSDDIKAGDFLDFLNKHGIKSCKETDEVCSNCFNSAKYLKWLGMNTDTILNEQNVKLLINNIVYVFVRKSETNSAVCKEFNDNVFSRDPYKTYEEIVEKYGHLQKLYLENLYHLTSDLIHIIKHHFDVETCLSTHKVATVLNLSHEVTAKDLTMFNLLIFYYFALNECSGNVQPKPESFINDLFKIYGNSTHISKAQFTELLAKLKIGSLHERYTETTEDSIFHLSHEHSHHHHHEHGKSGGEEPQKTSHQHHAHDEHDHDHGTSHTSKSKDHTHSHDDDHVDHEHGDSHSHDTEHTHKGHSHDDDHAGHDHTHEESTDNHKHDDHSSHEHGHSSHSHEGHDSHDHTHDSDITKSKEEYLKKHDHGHHGHGHDHAHEHSHNRKRRSINSKCLSAKKLYKTFDFTSTSAISKDQFKEICPALIQQIDSEACNNYETELPKHTHNHDHGKTAAIEREGSGWEPWIGAMLATFFVSLGSLSGVVAMPIHGKPFFSYILMTLICLAVATLAGDAILHLIPHSIGVHSHEEEGDSHSHDSHDETDTLSPDSFLWKFLLVIGGVYGFFLFEMLMHIFGSKHSHSHSIEHDDDTSIVDTVHQHSPISPRKDKQVDVLKACADDDTLHYEPDTKSKLLQQDHNNLEHCDKQCETVKNVDSVENGQEVHYHSSDDSIHTTTETNSNQAKSAFKSIVWMVLLGDAIHNFVDGVAIGVAFSEPFPAGLQGGISTSIAILCHELPHELGDFAVLISSGMSIKRALLMNFISSLTAFAGALIGVSIGTKWDATPWIFALTAGLFIYIAFVDMLPEVLNNKLLQKRPVLSFILQNIGLLSGFLIMFSLAAWEEKIIQLLG